MRRNFQKNILREHSKVAKGHQESFDTFMKVKFHVYSAEIPSIPGRLEI